MENSFIAMMKVWRMGIPVSKYRIKISVIQRGPHSKYYPRRGEYFVFGEELGDPPKVMQRLWRKHRFHYDNVPTACLTLFAVQTTEGWPV